MAGKHRLHGSNLLIGQMHALLSVVGFLNGKLWIRRPTFFKLKAADAHMEADKWLASHWVGTHVPVDVAREHAFCNQNRVYHRLIIGACNPKP
jgi:hypothetical protein